MEGLARVYLAEILDLVGDTAAAEAEARAALAVLEAPFPARALALGMLARLQLAKGLIGEALSNAAAAAALLEVPAGVEEGEMLVRVTHAEALAAAGRREAAHAAIADARDRLIARADRLHDQNLRASFLRQVPENARVLELARRWAGPETLTGGPARPRRAVRRAW